MRLKNCLLSAFLLVLAGCGCGDDSLLSVGGDQAETVAFNLGARVPPCEVVPPNTQDQITQIDVVFNIDDGNAMRTKLLGLVPSNLFNDPRQRLLGAREIMKNLQAQILADIAAAYGITPVEAAARFDFAFGVTGYCDFGGPFAAAGRNFPQDGQARPYTLKMPVIRQGHAQFDALFADALFRTSPGDGRVVRANNGAPFVDSNEPQSAVESWYQIATGAGFDGDGNASTNDSGAPCSLAAQTTPGESGDVPAVTFNATQDATDDDGRPMYFVRDSNGTATQIADPADAQNQITCFASGNLGGVGWRNNAARFIISSGDIATVAPFAGATPNTIGSVAGTTASAPATIGPATGPRIATTLPTAAFDSSVGRIGDPTVDATIAPVNAATVPACIAALNNLHIEVLCVGSPNIAANQAKPNGGQDNTDTPPDIPGTHIPHVVVGNGPNQFGDPTLFYWTHSSAISLLSGSPISFANSTGLPELFPAVYNLATVWPRDPALPAGTAPNPANITNHIREDLVQRVRNWVDDGFLLPVNIAGGGAAPLTPADMPTMTIPMTLTVTPSGTFGTNFTQTVGGLVANITANVPVYARGATIPASANGQFPDVGFQITDLAPAGPRTLTDTLQYQIIADLNGIVITPGASGTPLATDLAGQLQRKVDAWRVGEVTTITMTDASLIVTLEEFPLNTAEGEINEVTVQSVAQGCGFLNVTVGDGGPQQVGAPCNPFPAAP